MINFVHSNEKESQSSNQLTIQMEYNLKSYLDYQRRLKECAEDNRKDIIYNDSIVHAAMIYNHMFQKAQKDGVQVVNMFCGKLSILRNSTNQKLIIEQKRVRPADNTPEFDLWKDFHPFQDLVNTVENFFNDGGKLNVVLENQDVKDFTEEQTFPILKKAYEAGALYVRLLPFEVGLDHFTIMNNSYRCENSDENKTALCCFNDSVMTNVLLKSFQLLTTMASPFDITNRC